MSEPPAVLHARKPAWLLPWEDGLSSGVEERRTQHETGTTFKTRISLSVKNKDQCKIYNVTHFYASLYDLKISRYR